MLASSAGRRHADPVFAYRTGVLVVPLGGITHSRFDGQMPEIAGSIPLVPGLFGSLVFVAYQHALLAKRNIAVETWPAPTNPKS